MMIASMQNSMWTIAVDGMDQAKFRVPRLLGNRKSKFLMKLYRPALHVIGAWIHGFRLAMIVSDEDLKKDSETQCEAIIRSLNDAYGATDGFFPLGIHLQQDNTCREGKNQFVMGLLLLLVILRVLRFAAAGFQRPGHSRGLQLINYTMCGLFKRSCHNV